MPTPGGGRIPAMIRGGMCCSSIILQLALDERGERNEQMVSSAAALCSGLSCGLLCGALTGGACMLGLYCENRAETGELVKDLVLWFQSVYGKKYGGIDCSDITGGVLEAKRERCPALVEAVYRYAMTLLKEYGKTV